MALKKRKRNRVTTESRCFSLPRALDKMAELDRLDHHMGRSHYYQAAIRLLLRKHGVAVE